MTHHNPAADLRQLADFLDGNPALAQRAHIPTVYLIAVDATEFKSNNELLGAFTKSSTDNWLNATKTFGSISVQSTIRHENICEKVVTGTRKVTQYVPADPDYVAPEYVAVEVEEDVTEWVCPPTWR